ncbi:MAG: hypothetical protein E7666_02020 [Ruminococcaceae bacterium]|nr:hypothetical protein [Oscillospiraceae bacterium]
MKKLTVLLLLLSLLLCAFASCQQPDVPPVDSDSETGSESESESESESTEPEFTPSEWDPELKAFWDSFIAGEKGNPSAVEKNSISVLSSQMSSPVTITNEAKLATYVSAFAKIDAELTTPVTCNAWGELQFSHQNVHILTIGDNELSFVRNSYYVSGKIVTFAHVTLKVSDTQYYGTTFQLTKEQNSDISAALSGE